LKQGAGIVGGGERTLAKDQKSGGLLGQSEEEKRKIS